jgi:hypothetical protein
MHDQTNLSELVDIVGGFELTSDTLLNRILDAPVAPSTEALAEIMHLLLMALPALSHPLKETLSHIERLESESQARVAAVLDNSTP